MKLTLFSLLLLAIATTATFAQIENCSNGIDDDGDRYVDYNDSDCYATLVDPVRDSLALVALYNTNGGQYWIRNDNWLTGPMSTWYGVTLNQGTVWKLNLASNHLYGKLPTEINNLHGLWSFEFGDNYIDGIPSELFSSSPIMAIGYMGNNRLTFEDLLIQSRYFARLYDQQLIGEDTLVYYNEGESYTIHLRIDPDITTNQYVWFKDSVAFDTTVVNYYTLDNLTANDVGVYTCQVTNPNVVIDLTLYSHPTQLQIFTERQPQTILFDDLANRTFGDSSFALTASASSGLPVSYRVIEGEGTVVSIKNDTVTLVGAGDAAIKAWQSGDENYLPATPVVRKLIVTKASQYITFADLNDAFVGDTLHLQAPASSGLTVSFIVSGPARIDEERLILTGKGQVTVTATQAGSKAYLPAENMIQIVTVKLSLYSLLGQVFQGEGVPYTGEAAAVLYELDKMLGRNFRTQVLDENGTYRFDSLEAGRYAFKVSVRSDKYIPTYWRGHYLIIEAGAILIQRDTAIDVTLLSAPEQYEGTAIIRGRLIGNSSNGRTTEANQPLADVYVYLRDAVTGELVAYDATDEQGAFSFTQLPEGTYTFVADYEGRAMAEHTVRGRNDAETIIVATVAEEISILTEEEVVTAVSQEEAPGAILVFPNPVTDKLVIKVADSNWIGGTARLQNILENTVAEQTIQRPLITFAMSHQPAGVYVLTISKGNKVATYKVIK